MKNHYIKTKLKNSQKFPTAFHSLVYEKMPSDELFTLDRIVEKIEFLNQGKRSELADVIPRAMLNYSLVKLTTETFNQMIQDRLGVVEIHYTKLEKLFKTT